jgi:hypothetical protein
MLLQGFEIFKGIDVAKIAGMDQAHEHIADVGPMLGLEKQRIFPVQDRLFKRLFAKVMPTAGLCRVVNFIRFNWPKLRRIPYSHGSINRHNQRLSRNVSKGSSGRYRSGSRPLAVAWARACSLIPISACK